MVVTTAENSGPKGRGARSGPECHGARRAALALALFAGACDAAPPPETTVAEPTAALRPPDIRGPIPEDAHVVDHVLDARLDAETHTITGTARITWRNHSSRSVASAPLHLYMNAFRADDTVWMQEARGTHRSAHQGDDGKWGYTDLKAARLLGRGQVADFDNLEGTRGAAVDLTWKEGDDPTLATLTLPTPLGPGEAMVVEFEFVTQLPEVFARTGYSGDFHFMGQWFPRLGVLASDGSWQAKVFTLNSEFYADFGDYEVHLDVPENMVVGATGILVAADPPADGRKKLHYRAEMVHNFAWAADPNFKEYSVMWRDVRIRQLIQPGLAADAPKHLDALVATLESMDQRFGSYPWSTITVIHPPDDADGAAGMEYPTLFTTSDIWHMPPWARATSLEEQMSGIFTTIHEFGHQYFQGLLASDETRQPWLDEGLNTFANALVLMDWRGEDAWIARIGNQEFALSDFSSVDGVDGDLALDPVDAPPEAYRAVTGTYGDVVYRKTAALLLTLRNLVGPSRFDPAFKAYTMAQRFRHPTGDDLVATLVRELGDRPVLDGAPLGGEPVKLDVRTYFNQALHSVDAVDFTLDTVVNRRRAGEAGYHRDEHGALALTDREPEPRDTRIRDLPDDQVEAIVVVARRGEFKVPVEIELEFADDTRERVLWDGQARYRLLSYPGRRIRAARIDPDRKLLLEVRRLDNRRGAPEASLPDGVSHALGGLGESLALVTLGGLGL